MTAVVNKDDFVNPYSQYYCKAYNRFATLLAKQKEMMALFIAITELQHKSNKCENPNCNKDLEISNGISDVNKDLKKQTDKINTLAPGIILPKCEEIDLLNKIKASSFPLSDSEYDDLSLTVREWLKQTEKQSAEALKGLNILKEKFDLYPQAIKNFEPY